MDNPGHTAPYFEVIAMRDLHQLIFRVLGLEKETFVSFDDLQTLYREILTYKYSSGQAWVFCRTCYMGEGSNFFGALLKLCSFY